MCPFHHTPAVLVDRPILYRYRTLTDRLLQMRLIPARKLVKRNVSYEFMNRQMVWHAFTVSNFGVHLPRLRCLTYPYR